MKFEAKEFLVRTFTDIQMNRDLGLFGWEVVPSGFANDQCDVVVWCQNSAYWFELNALVMAFDGCGICNSMVVKRGDGNVALRLF